MKAITVVKSSEKVDRQRITNTVVDTKTRNMLLLCGPSLLCPNVHFWMIRVVAVHYIVVCESCGTMTSVEDWGSACRFLKFTSNPGTNIWWEVVWRKGATFSPLWSLVALQNRKDNCEWKLHVPKAGQKASRAHCCAHNSEWIACSQKPKKFSPWPLRKEWVSSPRTVNHCSHPGEPLNNHLCCEVGPFGDDLPR